MRVVCVHVQCPHLLVYPSNRRLWVNNKNNNNNITTNNNNYYYYYYYCAFRTTCYVLPNGNY